MGPRITYRTVQLLAVQRWCEAYLSSHEEAQVANSKYIPR